MDGSGAAGLGPITALGMGARDDHARQLGGQAKGWCRPSALTESALDTECAVSALVLSFFIKFLENWRDRHWRDQPRKHRGEPGRTRQTHWPGTVCGYRRRLALRSAERRRHERPSVFCFASGASRVLMPGKRVISPRGRRSRVPPRRPVRGGVPSAMPSGSRPCCSLVSCVRHHPVF
jgi:hypothetical protein